MIGQTSIDDGSKLVKKSTAERMLLLSTFYEQDIRYLDSLTIYTTINKVKALANKNNDIHLAYEIELMYLHFYAYRDHYPQEFVIEEIQKLDEEAKVKGVKWLEIRTQSLLANYLYNNCKRYGQGFEHFKRTALLLEDFTPQEFPLKQICLYQVARVYVDFNEYEEAKVYLTKALKASSIHDRYYYKMHILNTLGLYYSRKEELDSSNYYYKETLHKALEKKDSVWESIMYTNLGQNQFKREHFNKTISLVSKAIKIDKSRGSFIISKWVILGNSFLKLEKYQKAQEAGNKIEQFLNNHPNERQSANTYIFLSKLASFKGNPNLSATYLDKAIAVKDSLTKTYDKLILERVNQRIEVEKQKLQLEKERQIQANKLLFRNSIITMLILAILILILLYNRYRLKSKHKEQRIQTQREAAILDLENATIRLNEFKKSISQKNKLIEQFEEDFKNVYELNNLEEDSSQKSRTEIIQQLTDIAILTTKDWRNFAGLFKKVHIGFFERLKIRFPHLTESETRLMTLCRLKLDNKEMALMLGVGTPAIRQNKSRLRKKINLDKNTNLEKLSIEI